MSPIGALILELVTWQETEDPTRSPRRSSVNQVTVRIAVDDRMWVKAIELRHAMPEAEQPLPALCCRELRMRKSEAR